MSNPVIDLAFPLHGREIPLDHGYTLFAALSNALPEIRQRPEWGVHPVLGAQSGPGRLLLTKQSRLKLRVPGSDAATLLTLASRSLEVGAATVRLGFPQMLPLLNAATLKSRYVTIKGFHDDEAEFTNALRRQIAAVDGLNMDPERVELALGPRRVMRIKGKKVVGFAVALGGLDADASIALQCAGLGGRRHMGAGILVPPGRRR